RHQLVGLDQDVTGAGLLHHDGRLSATTFIELEDVESVRAAQQLGDSPSLQRPQSVEKQAGEPFALAPAEESSLQRFGCIRKCRGDLTAIRATLELAQRFFGTRTASLQLLRRGVLRDGDENVRYVEFVAAAG